MIVQIGIAVPGVIALWLVNGRKSRWGPVFGLLSEPCWLYTSIVHRQWGAVAMSVLYTVAWIRGVMAAWAVTK